MMSYADGCTVSAKKDGLVNMEASSVVNDDGPIRSAATPHFDGGFYTYGGCQVGSGGSGEGIGGGGRGRLFGLSGRAGSLSREKLRDGGFPSSIRREVMRLCHAKLSFPIFSESIPRPGHSRELYIEAGVRCIEIGAVAFARKDEKTGEWIYPPLELTRLAIPRRVYTDRHMDVVAEGLLRVSRERKASGDSELFGNLKCSDIFWPIRTRLKVFEPLFPVSIHSSARTRNGVRKPWFVAR